MAAQKRNSFAILGGVSLFPFDFAQGMPFFCPLSLGMDRVDRHVRGMRVE